MKDIRVFREFRGCSDARSNLLRRALMDRSLTSLAYNIQGDHTDTFDGNDATSILFTGGKRESEDRR